MSMRTRAAVSTTVLMLVPLALLACVAPTDGAPAPPEKIATTTAALLTPPSFWNDSQTVHDCSDVLAAQRLTFVALLTTDATANQQYHTKWSNGQMGTGCANGDATCLQHNQQLWGIASADAYRYRVRAAVLDRSNPRNYTATFTGPVRYLQGLASAQESYHWQWYPPRFRAPAAFAAWSSESHPNDGDQAQDWRGNDWSALWNLSAQFKGAPVDDGYAYSARGGWNGQPATCAEVWGAQVYVADDASSISSVDPVMLDAIAAGDDYDPMGDPW